MLTVVLVVVARLLVCWFGGRRRHNSGNGCSTPTRSELTILYFIDTSTRRRHDVASEDDQPLCVSQSRP